MVEFLYRTDFALEKEEKTIKNLKSGGRIKAIGVSEVSNLHGREQYQKAIRRTKRKLGERKARQVYSKAVKRGDNLHNILSEYFAWRESGLTYPEVPLLKSLKEFLNKIKRPIAQEYFVMGEVFNDIEVFGFCDILFEEKDGTIAIADWKTARKEKKQFGRHCIQIAAYAYLTWKRYGIAVEKAYVPIALTTGHRAQVIALEKEELANWVEAFGGMLGQFLEFPS